MQKRLLYFLFLCIIVRLIVGFQDKPTSPFSQAAENALTTFKLEQGFKIELVASEPLINDPVAMMIDESGRLYVVEMPGVPFDKSGTGKVILLGDRDGDAKFDQRTVFADSLVLPTGITRWKKGVIVTDPPNVYYMEDLNDDGKADIKEIMLTGFDTSNLEANVNNPVYGIDNWIYLANLPVVKGNGIHFSGDSNSTRLPESTVRFRPDYHQLESLSGKTQFGHTFDAWGNYFMVNNSNHIYQEIIAQRYLQRNPDLVVSNATQTLADHSDVFPVTINPEYQMLTDVGVFTSACGLTAYTGGAFPEKYNSNVTFVAEPVSNMIHIDRLEPEGLTFKAKRILEHKEFLASTDPYCRMVNMYVGPDGALYVIDFYRQIIEGPEFMSEDVLKKVNVYHGTGIGRIYRISATDAGPAKWTTGLQLGKATDDELVEKLQDKNMWWRMNAQRLLVDRKMNTIPSSLIGLTENASAPMGRLHALWTLEGINKLSSEVIKRALEDPLPGIRENAIRLAELHLLSDRSLISPLLKMKNDPDAKVRYQLLCTLGFINTPEVEQVRQELLFKDISDKWVQIAALTATSSQALPLLNAVIDKFDPSVTAHASLVQLLSGIIGKREAGTAIQQLLEAAISKNNKEISWQVPLINGLAKGLANRTPLPEGLAHQRALIMRTMLQDAADLQLKTSLLQFLKVIRLPEGTETNQAMLQAKAVASDLKRSEEEQALAIDLLGLGNPKPYESFLKQLIKPSSPLPVQLAALRTLKILPGEEVSKYLLVQWKTLSPELRNAAINIFLVSPERIKLLLQAVETGKVNKGAISWGQSVQLRSQGKYMDWARRLLTDTDDTRKNIIKEYQASFNLEGNSLKGMSVYQLNCAVCHQIAGKMGRSFGPDLGTVHAWSPADIITNILDPNKSISHGYDMWSVKLNNGKLLQGIISSETPTAIAITNTDGEVTNIARKDMTSLIALGMSAMPVGFEKKINKQQMADLLSYLRKGE